MGIRYIEVGVSRLFEDVKTNIFETAVPSRRLEDSQKGWSQEDMK